MIRFKKTVPKGSLHNRQRGISLFVVLIILLLSLIIVLGGLAIANLNESIVGNQSDAQRAYGAALALLDAAQLDIRLNGRYCNASVINQQSTNPYIVSGQALPCVLRYPSDGMRGYYPALENLISGTNNGSGIGCYNGLCISNNPTNPQFQTSKINTSSGAEQWENGANYNQFVANLTNYGSTAYAGANSNGSTSISLALSTAANSTNKSNINGKYWVEVFTYNVMGEALTGASGVAAPDGDYSYIFRITAMAQGLKSGTVSVLRTYYIPYPQSNKSNNISPPGNNIPSGMAGGSNVSSP